MRQAHYRADDDGPDFDDWLPVDEWLLAPRLRGYSKEVQAELRYMYGQLECWCASGLEAKVALAICIRAHMFGIDPVEIRDFVKPQYVVGWCKLDFLVAPFRDHPHVGFGIECDGEFWHNEERDQRRDAWILNNDPVVKKIYRFKGKELQDDAFLPVDRAFHDFRLNFSSSGMGEPFR